MYAIRSYYAADHFQQKVLALIDEIKNEIDKLKEAEKNQGTENEEVAKEHAMQQMSQQYGLSQEHVITSYSIQ